MAVPVDPRNVFTVDLEEWFHVCGVGGALAPANWDRLPSRVEPDDPGPPRSARRRPASAPRSSSSAGSPSGILGSIEAVLAAGHEIGSHGYHHARAYDLGPDAFRHDLRASVRALAAAGAPRVTMFRAPEWSINDRSLWALQTLVEEGVHARCEHGAARGSSATSRIRAILISGTRPPGRSPRCRRWSPIGSAR